MVLKGKSTVEPHAELDSALAAEKIQQQLQRILDSPEFQATGRQREFLLFVVSETLAGRKQEIKGYTIATEVFGRKDFDQATDPIVSIQANKLRRALERYYLVAGQNEPMRIDIPKGTYVPTFHERTDVEADSSASGVGDALSQLDGSWPSVLIRPFQNLTGDPDKDYLGIGLATELAIEVSRYNEIRAILHKPGVSEGSASDISIRFTIDGNVREDKTGIIVAVHLTDTRTNKQLWGDTHRCGFEASQLNSFQEEVARLVAAKTTGGHGAIAKILSKESKNIPPTSLKTYEAILQFYEYTRIHSPDSFPRAFQALEYATSIEPECGLVWSMLGRLYAEIYTLEYSGFESDPGFETALERAIECTEKGVQLNPDNQRTRVLLGYVRMISDEVPAALMEAEKALALNPRSLLLLDVIGYLFTLLGEWERGPAIIRKVIALNPFYNNYAHHALWLDWIRQEEYELAHLETLSLRTPLMFWIPVMKAATFGLLGRYDEGQREVENLLKLKPDFTSRGRVLMKHYIKFEEIIERLIEGLNKVGVSIK